jgi:hypothetical protein
MDVFGSLSTDRRACGMNEPSCSSSSRQTGSPRVADAQRAGPRELPGEVSRSPPERAPIRAPADSAVDAPAPSRPRPRIVGIRGVARVRAHGNFRRFGRTTRRYYALLAWFAAGLAAVPLVDNLGLVWVGIEATTIVSALLVGFGRSPQAIEAAWKYLILGSIGIGFALLGTLLVYASSVGVGDERRPCPVRGSAVRPGVRGWSSSRCGLRDQGRSSFHTWRLRPQPGAQPDSAMLSGAALPYRSRLARFHSVAVGALPAFVGAARRIGL